MDESKLFDLVLLLEDDMSHALIIKRALARYAREILHVQTLAEAVAALEQHRPDLVVSDLRLPDASGPAAIAGISGSERSLPLIVLSSSTSLKDAVEAMQLGARAYIVKTSARISEGPPAVAGLRGAAARARNTLRVAIENSNDGLAVVDAAGRVHYANASFRSFAKRCGGCAEDLARMFSPAVNKHEELADSVRAHLRELAPGAVWHTEVTLTADQAAAYDLSLGARAQARAPRGIAWYGARHKRGQAPRALQREILRPPRTIPADRGDLALLGLLKDMSAEGERSYEIALRIGSSAQGAINLITVLSARLLREGFIGGPPVIRCTS